MAMQLLTGYVTFHSPGFLRVKSANCNDSNCFVFLENHPSQCEALNHWFATNFTFWLFLSCHNFKRFMRFHFPLFLLEKQSLDSFAWLQFVLLFNSNKEESMAFLRHNSNLVFQWNTTFWHSFVFGFCHLLLAGTFPAIWISVFRSMLCQISCC